MDPASTAARVEKILERVARSRTEAALIGAARLPIDPARRSGALAAGMLMERGAPRRLEAIDKILDKHNIELGQPIGYGGEAIVFDAGDQVVKIAQDPFRKGRYVLPDVPGVAPYTVSEVVGPFRLGVQPRAAEVASRAAVDADRNLERLWRWRADRVADSLSRRGMLWDDAGWANVGIMPDGSLAAIDGWVTPGSPTPVAQRAFPTPEAAIRGLRVLRPGE